MPIVQFKAKRIKEAEKAQRREDREWIKRKGRLPTKRTQEEIDNSLIAEMEAR